MAEPTPEQRPKPQRSVLALRFRFFNANGSTTELPVILGDDDGKHRPLDRRETWLDVRKGSQVVLHYPGKRPEVRRVDQVILWMAHPTIEGMPEIVSRARLDREWYDRRSAELISSGSTGSSHALIFGSLRRVLSLRPPKDDRYSVQIIVPVHLHHVPSV